MTALSRACRSLGRIRAIRPVNTARGGVYRYTETLTGTASGGPASLFQEGERDRIAAAAAAGLQQRLAVGSAGVQDERAVPPAPGPAGPPEMATRPAPLPVPRGA